MFKYADRQPITGLYNRTLNGCEFLRPWVIEKVYMRVGIGYERSNKYI
jgi:hypothetical protein